jgi:hypothetical protein
MHIKYLDGETNRAMIMDGDDPLMFFEFHGDGYTIVTPADSYQVAIDQTARLMAGAEFVRPMWRNGNSSFSACGTRENLAKLRVIRELLSCPSWPTIVHEVKEGANSGFVRIDIAGQGLRDATCVTISRSGMIFRQDIEFAFASDKWSDDEIRTQLENTTSNPKVLDALDLAISELAEQLSTCQRGSLVVGTDPQSQPGYEFVEGGAQFRWVEHPNNDSKPPRDRSTTKVVRWNVGIKNTPGIESKANEFGLALDSFEVVGYLADRNPFPYDTPSALYVERGGRSAELRTTSMTDMEIMEFVQATAAPVMSGIVPALVQNGVEHYGRSLPVVPIVDEMGIANFSELVITRDPSGHATSMTVSLDPRALQADDETIQITEWDV